MKPRTRPVWIVLGCLLILCTAAVSTLTAGGCCSDMLAVRVQGTGPHGSDIAVRIPAILVPLALQVVPDEPLREIARAVDRWVPSFHEITSILADSPDCVLLCLNSPCGSVDTRKEEINLIVDVSSLGERIYVSMPIEILSSVVKRLEEVTPSS